MVIDEAIDHFIQTAEHAIAERGQFTVALSGGSTPKAIYAKLTPEMLDWTRVLFFWSDERSVPPDHVDSNYRMAMEAGLKRLPVNQIYRMHADHDIEVNAAAYEHLIKTKCDGIFDLVMLGMGEDGHTASLFPYTDGLHVIDRLVTPNYIQTLDTWRMTLTFPCINSARNVAIYVFGEKKRARLHEVLKGPQDPDRLPIQRVKNPTWFTDVGPGD